MSGAANCPETPRQRMIGMMYLVLTAMLALNVSADILNGFALVDRSLHTTIDAVTLRNENLMSDFEYLNSQNEAKVGEWLKKAKQLKTESDNLYNYIQDFKVNVIRIADGKHADPEGITVKNKENLDAAGTYALIEGNAKIFQEKLANYLNLVTSLLTTNNYKDSLRIKTYSEIYSTDATKNSNGELMPWDVALFESMPVAAVTTILTKYQNDVKATEADVLQFLKSQTDASDYRVNSMKAYVIPKTKYVTMGAAYQAQLVLSAVDSTKQPEYYVNGAKIGKDGMYTVNCNRIGSFPVKGQIVLTRPDGTPQSYEFQDEYTVVAPSATIANEDMNVVYMGYNNRISVSAPGAGGDKVHVTCNADMTRNGDFYIIRPRSYDDVVINVAAMIDGKSQAMGSGRFRVRTLPDPSAFLSFKDKDGNMILYSPNTTKHKLTRQELVNSQLVAEYADGLLQASFNVKEFTLLISDGRGGFNASISDGNNFTDAQKKNLMSLKSGSTILIDKIKVTGAKTTVLSYAPITLP